MAKNGNIQKNANLIWDIATGLGGLYKEHEYGNVILPLTVIKRFDDILEASHNQVLAVLAQKKGLGADMLDKYLKRTTGHQFYNTSRYTFKTLLEDAPNIKANLKQYLESFSPEVRDILAYYKFDVEIDKMSDQNNGDILYSILSRINAKEIDLHPDKITNVEMGYIFEELIRKFSESYGEGAGAHFTPREVVKLMVNILFSDDDEALSGDSKIKTIYDPACGTGGMLTVASEVLSELNKSTNLQLFGQELQPETCAIAKSDMLIKGYRAESIRHGNTISDDQFQSAKFDYIISNPPFGFDYKNERNAVQKEGREGFAGRFGIFNYGNVKGEKYPDVSDSQTLFLATAISKMKDLKDGGSRVAIIHNGSPLFTGDAGSAVSNLRRYILENDLLEAIIQLPNDIFYRTGITVYIWVLSNRKSATRKGKVQLIDASNAFTPLRKSIGKKRVEINENQIKEIINTFSDFEKSDVSKILSNSDFGYTKVTILQPLTDEKGQIIINKKGTVEIDSSKTDTENVPLNYDIDEYLKYEILPYAPHAWLDRSKDIVGYEIPFSKNFYKFVPPRSSDEIFLEIKKLENEEKLLMKELFGNE
jgi:type I restriction enzyme M protein